MLSTIPPMASIQQARVERACPKCCWLVCLLPLPVRRGVMWSFPGSWSIFFPFVFMPVPSSILFITTASITGLVTYLLLFWWLFIIKDHVKNVFLTKTIKVCTSCSRDSTVQTLCFLLNWSYGRKAKCPWSAPCPLCTQKALQRSKVETKELLGGTKEIVSLPVEDAFILPSRKINILPKENWNNPRLEWPRPAIMMPPHVKAKSLFNISLVFSSKPRVAFDHRLAVTNSW